MSVFQLQSSPTWKCFTTHSSLFCFSVGQYFGTCLTSPRLWHGLCVCSLIRNAYLAVSGTPFMTELVQLFGSVKRWAHAWWLTAGQIVNIPNFSLWYCSDRLNTVAVNTFTGKSVIKMQRNITQGIINMDTTTVISVIVHIRHWASCGFRPD